MYLKLLIKKLTNEFSFDNVRPSRRKGNLKREKKMAIPIATTPELSEKESRKFLENVKRDLKRPVDYTPTPKLPQARKLIMEYARKREK